MPVQIVAGEEVVVETASETAPFPVVEGPEAPLDWVAAPEGTVAVAHGAAVPAAHQACEDPVVAVAGGGGES